MNNKPRIPAPETIKRHVAQLREVCRQYDALNLLLDEAMASAEADIRNSPLTAYRLRMTKRVAVEESAEESSS